MRRGVGLGRQEGGSGGWLEGEAGQGLMVVCVCTDSREEGHRKPAEAQDPGCMLGAWSPPEGSSALSTVPPSPGNVPVVGEFMAEMK